MVETNSASGALHQAARPPGRSPSRSAVVETEAQTTLPATRITRNPDRVRRAAWRRSRNPPSCRTLRRIAPSAPIRLTKLISGRLTLRICTRRNEGATIIRHVGENGTSIFPALEIEAADDAFRLRSSSYGGQVGSNPPTGLGIFVIRPRPSSSAWRGPVLRQAGFPWPR